MQITYRDRLLGALVLQAQELSRSPSLNEMILHHEDMLSAFYAKKPLFYKMLFKHVRFHITTIVFSLYYRGLNPTLKSVKKFIHEQQKIICANTLNSLFLQLSVSGRLVIYSNDKNRRERFYRPSESAVQEIYDLIQSILKPYKAVHDDADGAAGFIPQFFIRYGDFALNNISMPELLPECALFIEKDAGHMIMLILYKKYLQQNSLRIMLSHKRIAAYCHVSRSHVCNLLKEAQAAGLLRMENNLFIELSDRFIDMFRLYYSLHLAQVLYAVGPAADQPPIRPKQLSQ